MASVFERLEHPHCFTAPRFDATREPLINIGVVDTPSPLLLEQPFDRRPIVTALLVLRLLPALQRIGVCRKEADRSAMNGQSFDVNEAEAVRREQPIERRQRKVAEVLVIDGVELA